MLADNPHSHPIIILPTEIRMWELQAVIEFMYKGEVNVSKDGLADLLRCAGVLQISGLCGAHAQNHLNQMVIGDEDDAHNDGGSAVVAVAPTQVLSVRSGLEANFGDGAAAKRNTHDGTGIVFDEKCGPNGEQVPMQQSRNSTTTCK